MIINQRVIVDVSVATASSSSPLSAAAAAAAAALVVVRSALFPPWGGADCACL